MKKMNGRIIDMERETAGHDAHNTGAASDVRAACDAYFKRTGQVTRRFNGFKQTRVKK